MQEVDLSEGYRLLEPGPRVEFTPPVIACLMSSGNASFATMRADRECVIAIPPLSLAAKLVEVGNYSDRDVDKFKALALTTQAARCVKAPQRLWYICSRMRSRLERP